MGFTDSHGLACFARISQIWVGFTQVLVSHRLAQIVFTDWHGLACFARISQIWVGFTQVLVSHRFARIGITDKHRLACFARIFSDLGWVHTGFGFSQICTDWLHRFSQIGVLRTDFLRFGDSRGFWFSQICTDGFHRFSQIGVLRTDFLRFGLGSHRFWFLTDLHGWASQILTDWRASHGFLRFDGSRGSWFSQVLVSHRLTRMGFTDSHGLACFARISQIWVGFTQVLVSHRFARIGITDKHGLACFARISQIWVGFSQVLVSHRFARIGFSQIWTDGFHRFSRIGVLRTDFLRFGLGFS
jgi:hypothetical protein